MNTFSTSDITFDSVVKSMRDIAASIPPPPTAEQLDFAYFFGFPGWPSYKLGRAAYDKLRQEIPLADSNCNLDTLCGIQIVLDEQLPANAVLSVEDLWRAIDPQRLERKEILCV